MRVAGRIARRALGRPATPTQAAEAAAGGDGCAADGAAPAVREHNLYVKHFEAGVDSAALRGLFEARARRPGAATAPSCLARSPATPCANTLCSIADTEHDCLLGAAGAAGAQELGDVVSGAVLYNHVGESKQARRSLLPTAVLGSSSSLLGLGGSLPAGWPQRLAAPLHNAVQAEKRACLWALHADKRLPLSSGCAQAVILLFCSPSPLFEKDCVGRGGPHAVPGRAGQQTPACHAAGLDTQALEPGGTGSAARAGGLRANAHRAAGAAQRRHAARQAGAHRQACRAAGSEAWERAAHSARCRARGVMQTQLDVTSSVGTRTEAAHDTLHFQNCPCDCIRALHGS